MANGATSPTLGMAAGSLLAAAGRNKSNECCDPLAAGNRCRLGGCHSTTHAPTPATCPGQYGMDLAGSEGSSDDEPYLVVAWPQGQVIGINTLAATQAEPGVAAQGIGFAISITTAKPIAEQLAASGQATHPYVGVSLTDLTPALARR